MRGNKMDYYAILNCVFHRFHVKPKLNLSGFTKERINLPLSVQGPANTSFTPIRTCHDTFM